MMLTWKYWICGLFFMLGTAGCAVLPTGSGPTPQSSRLPSWAVSPPPDNQQYWYGVGSALSRDRAIRHALNEVASRLKATVQSDIRSHVTKTVRGDDVQVEEIIKGRARLVTEEITFPGHKLQQVEQLDSNVHVLVRVDRDNFSQRLHNKLDHLNRSISESFARVQDKRPIEQHIAAADLLAHVAKAESIIDLLAAADAVSVQEVDTSLGRLQAVRSHLEENRDRLRFRLVADPNSRYVATVLRQELTEAGFPVVEQSGRRQQDDTIIKLSSEAVRAQSEYGYTASLQTQLTMHTTDRYIVGSRRIHLYGVSVINREQALRAAAEDFAKKLKAEGGIFCLIGQGEC